MSNMYWKITMSNRSDTIGNIYFGFDTIGEAEGDNGSTYTIDSAIYKLDPSAKLGRRESEQLCGNMLYPCIFSAYAAAHSRYRNICEPS